VLLGRLPTTTLDIATASHTSLRLLLIPAGDTKGQILCNLPLLLAPPLVAQEFRDLFHDMVEATLDQLTSGCAPVNNSCCEISCQSASAAAFNGHLLPLLWDVVAARKYVVQEAGGSDSKDYSSCSPVAMADDVYRDRAAQPYADNEDSKQAAVYKDLVQFLQEQHMSNTLFWLHHGCSSDRLCRHLTCLQDGQVGTEHKIDGTQIIPAQHIVPGAASAPVISSSELLCPTVDVQAPAPDNAADVSANLLIQVTDVTTTKQQPGSALAQHRHPNVLLQYFPGRTSMAILQVLCWQCCREAFLML
jgi:hypothetical protein